MNLFLKNKEKRKEMNITGPIFSRSSFIILLPTDVWIYIDCCLHRNSVEMDGEPIWRQKGENKN